MGLYGQPLNIKFMNSQFRIYSIFFVLFMVLLPLSGQDDCRKTLENAGKLYEQGMIDDIPEMLAPCMESGFTRTEKIEAYKLMIMVYLFNDDQFEAENTMVEFLKKFPEYEIHPNDPVEFVYLFETYRTTSVFSINLTFGPNLTNPRIIEIYTAGDINNASLENYSGTGFQIGLGIGKDISKNLRINLDLYYATKHYNFTEEFGSVIYDEPVLSTITFNEKITGLDIPLTAVYEFNIPGNLNYFLRSGFGAGFINKASGTPKIEHGEGLPDVTGGDVDIINKRNPVSWFYVIGGGLKYKVPRGYFVVDARFNLGLNNIVNTGERYSASELWSKYHYIDDDFALNNVSLVVGYHFSFYQPRKRRH